MIDDDAPGNVSGFLSWNDFYTEIFSVSGSFSLECFENSCEIVTFHYSEILRLESRVDPV